VTVIVLNFSLFGSVVRTASTPTATDPTDNQLLSLLMARLDNMEATLKARQSTQFQAVEAQLQAQRQGLVEWCVFFRGGEERDTEGCVNWKSRIFDISCRCACS
jgi:hypothetical protein